MEFDRKGVEFASNKIWQ